MKDFPDPLPSGHLNWGKLAELGYDGGEDPSKHWLTQLGERRPAGKVCGPILLLANSIEPRVDQAKLFDALLKHAACMRKGGVSDFGDPTMASGNVLPGGVPGPRAPSRREIDARKACDPRLPAEMHGRQ